jgi:hypothetical protein
MQQGPEKIKLRYNFVIYTSVNRVEKVGEVWYANFLGSWESIAFGEEKPFEVGDKVKITFERIEDDNANKE